MVFSQKMIMEKIAYWKDGLLKTGEIISDSPLKE